MHPPKLWTRHIPTTHSTLPVRLCCWCYSLHCTKIQFFLSLLRIQLSIYKISFEESSQHIILLAWGNQFLRVNIFYQKLFWYHLTLNCLFVFIFCKSLKIIKEYIVSWNRDTNRIWFLFDFILTSKNRNTTRSSCFKGKFYYHYPFITLSPESSKNDIQS